MGLLGDVLPYIYSRGNALKRQLYDFVQNPREGLLNIADNVGRDIQGARRLVSEAADESSANLKAGRGMFEGPANSLLAQKVADSYNPGGIFVGQRAQTFNNAAAKQFEQLEKGGTAKAEAWRQTGTMRLPEGPIAQEVSDHASSMRGNPQARTVGEAFSHPELYAAYPAIARYPFGVENLGPGIRGALDPDTNLVRLSPGLTPAEQRSTILHELNHAVQFLEPGFGKGGNFATAKREVSKNKTQAQAPFFADKFRWEEGLAEMGPASKGLYIKQLEELSQKQGIKPSRIHNLSDWYQYANEIRARQGAAPTKAGAERDAWYQGAAQYILNKNLDDLLTPWPYDPRSQMTVEELKRQYQRGSRKMAASQDGMRTYTQIGDRYRAIQGMSDGDAYLRLPGEAMSRLTQTRQNHTPEMRSIMFPLDELDIPLREYAGGGLLNP